MATQASFNDMLKRYMPYSLLEEEMKKRMFFWDKVEKDNGWEEGVLEVPFVGNEASSLLWGSLTPQADIAEADYVLGTVSVQPELWGTMIFNEKDLRRHVSMEKSYLKILPGKIDQFVRHTAERVSIQLLDNGTVSKVTGDGQVGGTITVARPYLFQLGERVEILDDDTAAPAATYITAIDVNSGVLTIEDARSGGSAVDLSAYTVAANAKVQVLGTDANGMTSLADQLLSAGNGGSATIAGQTKADYPHLQARNIDGSGFSASTLLDDVFDAHYDISERGKGNPTEILMSMGNYKNIAKDIETNRRYAAGEAKAGYGFRSTKLIGSSGDIVITALRDMPDDKMYFMDWSALKFYHPKNAFERKRTNGEEFFVIRATSGYQYVVDIRFAGDLIVHQPSHCGVVYGVNV